VTGAPTPAAVVAEAPLANTLQEAQSSGEADGQGGGSAGDGAPGETDIAENTPDALPGFSAEDMARLKAQTGNPFVDLYRGNIAWGNLLTDATWSLLNTLIAIASFIIAAMLIAGAIAGVIRRRRLDAGEAETRSSRVTALNISVAVAGMFIFLFTLILALGIEYPQPVTWINKWTPMTAALLAAQVVFVAVRDMGTAAPKKER
jgi:hypothetical protein